MVVVHPSEFVCITLMIPVFSQAHVLCLTAIGQLCISMQVSLYDSKQFLRSRDSQAS